MRSTSLTTKYITPSRIVWKTDESGEFIKNSEYVLKPGSGQADLRRDDFLMIRNDSISNHGIILDFGREIQGGIEIVAPRGNMNPAGTLRIRFGESVAEVMSDVGEKGATNDHAIRDFEILVPKLGRINVGESGFRFVRIDLVNPNSRVFIKEISAVFRYRDIPYKGSFKCNDQRLNDIWMTGAYTVHLNMQDYLWDGIKRDRLIWVGDMHPEVMTINSVFGYNEVVPETLDFVKKQTPLPNYMNGIGSYSIWWILIQRDWYYYQGDLEYLKKQKEYLTGLLNQLSDKIKEDGSESLDGERFLDWPSSENKDAIHAGLHSLMLLGFEAGKELSEILGDKATVKLCEASVKKLKKHTPSMAGSKQAAALLAMANLVSPEVSNKSMLAQNGVKNMSTFYGYYMLIARAMAGDYQGAIDNIREYWGAMLDLGATTFWEDFNIDWKENAARIDEIVPENKVDVHGEYGDYCYVGYRHSLCHGWASGPTAWLSRYVLGVHVVDPGCKKIVIEPHLSDLNWVEGTFPTPYGLLELRHEKLPNGSVKTTYKKPQEIEVELVNSNE
ncbi:alpha-L-rhamnosidase-related protein [Tamlana flava]|uniref:alpha-L-rhamnosidase-related protein n=1 Tax=Tamlana flava TaxID=3158572 RepID=UPI00351BB44F